MSERFASIKADAFAAFEEGRDFVGEFVFQAFGYQSSDAVNTATLIAFVLLALFCVQRITRRAPQHRHRYHPSDYDYGRNH